MGFTCSWLKMKKRLLVLFLLSDFVPGRNVATSAITRCWATCGFGYRSQYRAGWAATECDDGSYRMLFLRANR
jgi:hypothetical protein